MAGLQRGGGPRLQVHVANQVDSNIICISLVLYNFALLFCFQII